MTSPVLSDHPEILIEPGDRWWVSKTNLIDAVRQGVELPSRIQIRDCTIREGEEMGGASLSVAQKVELARFAWNLGIGEIEVGYCGAIREHQEMASLLRSEGIGAILTSLNRSYIRDGEWQREVDAAVEAGVDCVYFIGFCNDDLLASVPWLSRSDVPNRIQECVTYAKKAGARVAFTLAGTTRTPLDAVAECASAAAAGGADVVGVADSMGCALPEAVTHLVQLTREAVGPNVEISFHGHNTFGLATANALAAIRGGAQLVDAVPLGLGEGAGIAPLEEVVFAIEVLYQGNTGLAIEKLADYARLAQQIFGVTPLPTKTVIGSSLYRHSIDSHIASILRGNWHSWECIRPEVVGQQRVLEFGYGKIRRGRSGAIEAKAEQLGYAPNEEQLEAIIDRLTAVAKEGGWASEEQVEDVIRSELGTDE